MCCQISLLGKLCVLVQFHWNEKIVPGVSWTSPYAPLPFSYLLLYIFCVINHKHEYNAFLSPFSKTFTLTVVLELVKWLPRHRNPQRVFFKNNHMYIVTLLI